MPGATRKRTGELARELLDILSRYPDGLLPRNALEALAAVYKAGAYARDGRRFAKMVSLATVDLTKAGWLTKQKGRWKLTEEGRAALIRYPDPEAFHSEASRLGRREYLAPPFQFRLSSTIREAQRLSEAPDPLWVLGDAASHPTPKDRVVWRLLLEAVNEERLQHYLQTDECCEGCVMTSSASIQRIDSLVRLAKSALGGNASGVSLVYLTALEEGIRECRHYLGGFTPDVKRGTPWGEGNREDYLHAMHLLRAHLVAVLGRVRECIC